MTLLDQHSADVLIEIAGLFDATGDDAIYFKKEVHDHWRYAQASTVASGSTEVQRILLARSLINS